jgi:hypothetical protein
MRGAGDHTLHHMFDDVAAAAGFSRDDIGRWVARCARPDGT